MTYYVCAFKNFNSSYGFGKAYKNKDKCLEIARARGRAFVKVLRFEKEDGTDDKRPHFVNLYSDSNHTVCLGKAFLKRKHCQREKLARFLKEGEKFKFCRTVIIQFEVEND